MWLPQVSQKGSKADRTGKVFAYPFEEQLDLRTDDLHSRHLRAVCRTNKVQFGLKGPTFLV